MDGNGDGRITGERAGSGYNTYCEDGAHCFNVHECRLQAGQKLDAEMCRDILCKYFQNSSVVETPSSDDASAAVRERFELGVAAANRGAGTCNLANVTDAASNPRNTWWKEYFAAPDICASVTPDWTEHDFGNAAK